MVNGGVLNLTDVTVSGTRAKDGVGGILNTFAASPATLTLTFSTAASNNTGAYELEK